MESRPKVANVDETDTRVEGLLKGLPPRYRPRRILGHGSQKCVYLAHDGMLDRPVAIAAIDLSRLGDAAHERLHEARTMARIGDVPHVVPIYDVIEGPEHLFIVSRFFPGGDLAKHLKAAAGRVLPVRRALEIAAQIALALAHAHDHGVSHRDVKPGNVFLDARGDAFLGDFGIAVVAGSATGPEALGLVGTLAYMPPEQIWGTSAEPSCDLYALGAVVYELVCGAPPFVGSSPTEVLYKHENEAPVPPQERNPKVPTALSDLALKLLAKHPKDRPASSHEVHAALHGILRSGLTEGAEVVPLRPTAEDDRLLLGRESRPAGPELALANRFSERAALDLALTRAWSGQPRVLLVSGEAGVGKSRLLRELRLRAEAEGGIALVGQGYEDVPLPYRSLVEALLPLAGRLSEIGEADAVLLRRLLHLGATVELATARPEATDPQRLFLAVSRALSTFAQTRPLLIMIEDLHWVDRASLDVFEDLAFRFARGGETDTRRILLLGSHRPLPPEDRTARALARIAREERCDQVTLEGLEEQAVHELIGSLGIEQPSSGLVRTVCDATGGNPLFVREVVHHLERSGAIEDRGGAAVASMGAAEVEIPSSIAGAVAARVAKLDLAAQRLLSLGALLGHRFDLRLLASVAELDEDEAVDALEGAVRDRLIVDEGQSYLFGHPVVRQVLLQGPSPSRRQRLHLRIATRLEEMRAARPDGGILRIAHHLVRAGAMADPAKVIRRARSAAFRALGSCAWHEAAELFEAALAAALRAPVATDLEIAELHAWAGYTYSKSDDRGPCIEHLDAAIEGFRASGDRRGFLTALHLKTRARIDFGVVAYRDLDDIRPLEEGLGDLGPEDDRLRARILGTVALVYWAAQEPARAAEGARAAIELARRCGDDRLCAELSVSLGLAQFQQLELGEALATWQTGLEHAHRADDPPGAVACVQRMPMALFMLGDLKRAEQMIDEGRELNRTVQNHGLDALGFAIRASVGVVRGDFAAAEHNAQEALGLQRRTHFPWAGITAEVSRACSFALRGDAQAATAAIDQIFVPGRIFDDPSALEPIFWPNRRIAEAYTGMPVTLGDDPPGFIPPPAAGEVVDSSMITAYCFQVELADFGGRPEFAARVEPVLALAEERGVVLSFAWPLLLARVRGIAAMLAGRRDEARRHLERAVATADRLGALPELARSQLDLARLLASDPSRAARSAAAASVVEAAERLRAAGMASFLERARSLAAQLEVGIA
jgi:tetratricopeptide (TPR) repeat protein